MGIFCGQASDGKSSWCLGKESAVHRALCLGTTARTSWGAGKTALTSLLFPSVTSKREELALPSLAQPPCAEITAVPHPCPPALNTRRPMGWWGKHR